jgi:hypothetical protein
MVSQHDAHLPIPDAERVAAGKAERAARPASPPAAGHAMRDEARPGAQEALPLATPMPSKGAADVLSKSEARKEAAKPEHAAPPSAQPAASNEQPPASAVAPDFPSTHPPSADTAHAVAPTGAQTSGAASARGPLQPAPEAAEVRAPGANARLPEPASARVPEREASIEAKSQAGQPEPMQEAPPAAARARAKAQAAPAAPAQRAAEDGGAGALQPLEWIERIRELRRKGHTAEAEASLKAFRERYPDYALPADLVAPR